MYLQAKPRKGTSSQDSQRPLNRQGSSDLSYSHSEQYPNPESRMIETSTGKDLALVVHLAPTATLLLCLSVRFLVQVCKFNALKCSLPQGFHLCLSTLLCECHYPHFAAWGVSVLVLGLALHLKRLNGWLCFPF